MVLRSSAQITGLFLIIGILSGCSMEASIGQIASKIEVFQKKSSLTEVTPSSGQGIVTSGGYEVQSSINFLKTEGEIGTPGGYKVESSIQSTLFKEL